MRRRANYTWQDYKTNGYILSELKINAIVKKIQNYRHKWVRHFRRMDRDRLRHFIMQYQPCGKRSQGRHLRRFLEC